MTRLLVDAELRSKLCDSRQTVELYDEAGKLLGYFYPAADPADYARAIPRVSDEELRRRVRQGGGRPLADILADLEKRA
jgi:hypothetical protein